MAPELKPFFESLFSELPFNMSTLPIKRIFENHVTVNKLFLLRIITWIYNCLLRLCITRLTSTLNGRISIDMQPYNQPFNTSNQQSDIKVSICLFTLLFSLWSTGIIKSTEWQVLLLTLCLVFQLVLVDPFLSPSHPFLSHSPRKCYYYNHCYYNYY